MKFRESETLELKKSSSELNAAIVSIVSILNKHGIGELYFGIKNDGSVVGQDISEKTLRDISQAIAENIEPKIYPEIKMVKIDNKSCIYIKFSGDEKPYYAFGRAYIRVGDEDRKLSAKEIENIILNKKIKSIQWDSQWSDQEISCVSEKTVEKFVKKANEVGRLDFKYESVEITLRKLSLINNGRLSNAADVLFCSENPLELQAAVFAGKDKLTFLDIKQLQGNIFDLLEESELYIKNHIDWRVKFGKLEREEIPEIPLEAVREALVNSMCHKDYRIPKSNEIAIFRDRVEIYNPGTFPEGLTPEGFITGRERSVLRNPLIAQTLYYSKDIEKWGSGLKRIYEDCKDNHVKVEFQVLKTGFLVIFYRNNIAAVANGNKVHQAHFETDQYYSKKLTDSMEIPGPYRDWIIEFHARMDIQYLDPNARAFHVPLPEVYIPIETANPFYKPGEERLKKDRVTPIMGDVGHDEEKEEVKESTSIDIEELLGRQECILLRGSAGMGKTTLIKHLAYTIIHGQGPVPLHGYLPVVIFLKDLWPIYESKAAEPQLTFRELLNHYLENKVKTLKWEEVEGFIKKDRALFLLDGLDEVPAQLRPGLVELTAAFWLKNKNNRFLLTGRPHGIDDEVKKYFSQFLRDIELLDDKKIKEFIRQWFLVVSGQAAGLAEETAAEMTGDIEVNEYISVFTQNPLLLTAVCVLYLDNKRLPDQRSELYSRIVDNLLYRRFHQRNDPARVTRIEDYLKSLAFRMMTGNCRTMDIGEAKELLMPWFAPGPGKIPYQHKREIDALFNEIEPQCGLLKRVGGRGEGEIEFFHLSFQEFLAARQILYLDLDYRQYLDKEWWEETLLLYTGLINREWKDKANGIVKEILTGCHDDEKVLHRWWLLGGKALRDIQEYKRAEKVIVLAREKLMALMDKDIDLKDRLEAGEIIGILGDPRIKPPPMVIVEAGEFTMGSDEVEDERPIHRVYLDEFMIGKYPVTNEEFKAFIADKGYKNEALWTPEVWQWLKKENITEPRYWHDRRWNGPNFPVVGVSWYEAAAYAKWLSQKTGDQYVLPTEAQWEKAARGNKGLVYPWGNKFDKNLCNSGESGLGRTSPVGTFPAGVSPYGCMDMAGNVWEWCADWYKEEYYKKSPAKNPKGPSDSSTRVVRGGGWASDDWVCRTACRDWAFHPAYRDFVVGFRLLRAL
jgi:ATP-dependent DNA helicase RecG